MTIESSAAGNGVFTSSFAFIYRKKLEVKNGRNTVQQRHKCDMEFLNLFYTRDVYTQIGLKVTTNGDL